MDYWAENTKCSVHHSIIFANEFGPLKDQDLGFVSVFFTAWLHAELFRFYPLDNLIFEVLHICIDPYKELLIYFMSPLLQIMHGASDLWKTKAL